MKKCSILDCANKHYGRGFCAKHYQRLWKYGDAQEPLKLNPKKAAIKQCKKCGLVFEGHGCKQCKQTRASIRRAENPDKARAYEAAWRTVNKEKDRAAKAAWQKANPDKVKAKNDAYYSANPERYRAMKKVWRDVNAEKIKVKNAVWSAANRDKTRVYCQNYRLRKLKAGGVLSKDLFSRLFGLQKGRCSCCGACLKANKPHLDHIMPLSLGGSNEDNNIQLLCRTCNLNKHAKHPVDFMQQRGFLL